MKYDVKLTFFSLNGINLTHFGEVKAKRTIEGDFIDPEKGIAGDSVTHAKYDYQETFESSQLANSPHMEQIESWAKNHTQLSAQYKDQNTGKTCTSTTAYVKNLQPGADGKQSTFTIYCEEVQ